MTHRVILLLQSVLVILAGSAITFAYDFHINIDGKINDWADVPVVVQDYVGDSKYPNMDIDSVYIFKDYKNLYLAVKTTGKPPNSENVDYFFGIDVNIDGRDDYNIDVVNGRVSLTKYYYSGDSVHKSTKLLPDAKVAIDEAVEVSIPLEALQHSGRIKFIGSGIYLLDEKRVVDFLRGWEYLCLLNNTIKIETRNLTIYYPAVIDEKEAEKHAIILQDFYDFMKGVTNSTPFNKKKIVILFDSSVGYISYYGNPIVMGMDSGIWQGKTFPPAPPFFHELVHVFTSPEISKAYTDMNGGINEAFSDLFTYYYGKYILNDAEYNSWETYMFSKITEYENEQISPATLDWKAHSSAQPYVMAMLFVISEKYGWNVWNKFFELSKEYEFLRPEDYKPFQYTDLSESASKDIFNRFVLLLSLATNEDLRPVFEHWRFDFPYDEKLESLYPYKKAEAPILTVTTTTIPRTPDVILDDDFTGWNVDTGNGNIAYRLSDRVNFVSGNASLKLVAKIDSKTERFAAVWHSTAGIDLSEYDGIEFWSYVPYPMDGAMLFIQLWEENRVVYYKIVRNLTETGWSLHRIPFSELEQGWWGNEDKNGKLDLDRIVTIAISIDANSADSKDFSINIDGMRFYKEGQDDLKQSPIKSTPTLDSAKIPGFIGISAIFALILALPRRK